VGLGTLGVQPAFRDFLFLVANRRDQTAAGLFVKRAYRGEAAQLLA
jgi:hypothetical protein